MCYAYPYQEVIDGVYSGYASRANSLVRPSVLGYQEDGFFFETDLEKARELLAAAGVAEGTELILLQATGSNPAMSELFQANLAEIGITLTIEPVDQGTRAATFYGDTPAEERPNFMLWSWWPDYNDAWNVLYPTTSCDRGDRKGPTAGSTATRKSTSLLEEAKNASTLETYTQVSGRGADDHHRAGPTQHLLVAAEVADRAAGKHRRVRLQSHQPRHVRLLDAVPEGVAEFS